MMTDEAYYRAAERRVEFFTLGLGMGAGLFLFFARGWPDAAGILTGAALGWVNYRWLKQGMNMMARVAAEQADAPAVRIPKSTYVKFFGRYALIIAVLYGIFSNSLLPAAAVIGGLFAPVGAVVVETLYQLFTGSKRADNEAK
ncbi:MAG: ATP synthase subunit I [Acidobacteria bacterium]|nr:ATP synthase subunit I [Acidobacteriota bacterium]MBI3484269.1 ATP synthase subunit I [Acidobacteriota bacterium]